LLGASLVGFVLLNYQIVKDLVLDLSRQTSKDLAHEGFELKTQNPMRVAVVQRLSNQNLRRDVNEEKKPLGPVKCVSQTAANGKNFFNLVDA